MRDHFFYVSKKKHHLFFKTLIIINLICTGVIIHFALEYSHKSVIKNHKDVIDEFLFSGDKVDSFYSYSTFKLFLKNLLEVG
jgi:hypothetical protein